MRRSLVAFLPLSFAVASCGDPAGPTNATSITTGTSFGECAGFCFQEVVFRGVFAFYVKRDYSTGQVVSGKTRLSFEESQKLAQAVDLAALQALPEVIGCPDCTDGGAEWVEIEMDGVKTRVLFEFGSDFPTIQPLLDASRALRRVVLEGAGPSEAP